MLNEKFQMQFKINFVNIRIANNFNWRYIWMLRLCSMYSIFYHFSLKDILWCIHIRNVYAALTIMYYFISQPKVTKCSHFSGLYIFNRFYFWCTPNV
jgi:uncharacterized membrane protein